MLPVSRTPNLRALMEDSLGEIVKNIIEAKDIACVINDRG
jgi:hypothetical protein